MSQQEDFDDASLEDQGYSGDASMFGPKTDMLLRDSKKELMRYIMFNVGSAHSGGPGTGEIDILLLLCSVFCVSCAFPSKKVS
jgi:hypothetical protein